MSSKKISFHNPYFVIYLTAFYVVAQFLWWAYLILKQTYEIQDLRASFEDLSIGTRKIWMVLGEGTIFFVLIILAFKQILKSLEKEKKLAQQQTNFLLSVTHELKTPLASNKLILQTLEKDNIPNEKKAKLIQTSIQQTDRLSKLVENILMASQIEGGTYSTNQENIPIKSFISEISQHLFSIYQRKHILVIDISDDLVIKSDKIALYSVFYNLLENAMKYAPENTEIRVNARQEKKSISFIISDLGKGINKKEKAMIFNKFYRIGDENTRNAKGTGLGLYIVKRLVESLNGEIRVEDNIPNGTQFIITLKYES